MSVVLGAFSAAWDAHKWHTSKKTKECAPSLCFFANIVLYDGFDIFLAKLASEIGTLIWPYDWVGLILFENLLQNLIL